MRADDLIDAFGNIDPKYVSDAEVEIKSKSRMKRMFYVITRVCHLLKNKIVKKSRKYSLVLYFFVILWYNSI